MHQTHVLSHLNLSTANFKCTTQRPQNSNHETERQRNLTVANLVFTQTTYVAPSKSNFAQESLNGSSKYKFYQNRLKVFRDVGVESAISHYFGRWLIQQLVLLYKSLILKELIYFCTEI